MGLKNVFSTFQETVWSHLKDFFLIIKCKVVIFHQIWTISPDHQTWTDFTSFGEKSPGVATLVYMDLVDDICHVRNARNLIKSK